MRWGRRARLDHGAQGDGALDLRRAQLSRAVAIFFIVLFFLFILVYSFLFSFRCM